MGRKSRTAALTSSITDELEASIRMTTQYRKRLEDLVERGEKVTLSEVRGLSTLIGDIVKTKLAYDKSQHDEAVNLTAAQEQAVVLKWIKSMSKTTQERFIAKLKATLSGDKLPTFAGDETYDDDDE